MDFSSFINLHKSWSLHTFGKGKRTESLIEHIRHELKELQDADNDSDRLEECIDIIFLAIGISYRLGFTAYEIEERMMDKFVMNQRRKWKSVEFYEANQDEPTFHIKD